MAFQRLLSDASVKFNRVVQKTGETFLSTEKTEYDEEYKLMITKLDLLNLWSDRFIKEASAVLEPNVANRLEDKMLDKLDRKSERPTVLEHFGTVYEKASEDFAPHSQDLSKFLSIFGKTEARIGVTCKEFQREAMETYVSKVKEIVTNDLNKFQEERRHLENLRLDYDGVRSKARRSNSDPHKQTIDDSLTKAESAFNDQLEKNKILFQEIDKLFVRHQHLLKAFVKAQMKYHDETLKELVRLDTQLQ